MTAAVLEHQPRPRDRGTDPDALIVLPMRRRPMLVEVPDGGHPPAIPSAQPVVPADRAGVPSAPPQLLRRWVPAAPLRARAEVTRARSGPHRLGELLPGVFGHRPRAIAVPVAPLWQEQDAAPVRPHGTVSAAARIPSRPPRATPPATLPPGTTFATAFARVLVEVLAGRRGCDQLEYHCAPEVLMGLRQWCAAPPAAGVRLLVTHASAPAADAVDVAAAVRFGGRVRALAMRLRSDGARWLLTDLQIG